MAVNSDKPSQWKSDIARSVDFYNNWFLRFAPQVYRNTRVETTKQVESAMKQTANLTNIAPITLRQNPSVLPILRMATAPPIARDRLIGLADVSPSLVKSMELDQQIPPRMKKARIDAELAKVGKIIAVRSILFLCGYFDSGYLGYEAAEGIDWVWEHRIDDLALFGV